MRAFVAKGSSILVVLSVAFYPHFAAAQQNKEFIFPKDTGCYCRSGKLGPGEKAFSPTHNRYAQEVKPLKQGNIGIFDSDSQELLATIQVSEETDNDLKAIAWDPRGERLLSIFHHDEDPATPPKCTDCGYVKVFNVKDAKKGNILKEDDVLLHRVNLRKWYCFVAFVQEGKQLVLSTRDGEIEETVDIP